MIKVTLFTKFEMTKDLILFCLFIMNLPINRCLTFVGYEIPNNAISDFYIYDIITFKLIE